jgi:hypothetical protein
MYSISHVALQSAHSAGALGAMIRLGVIGREAGTSGCGAVEVCTSTVGLESLTPPGGPRAGLYSTSISSH